MNFKFSKISKLDFYNNKSITLKREISAKIYDIEDGLLQKDSKKYGRFLLSQGKSKIVAIAFGETYELVKNVLKKSNKIRKFPAGTFYCKRKDKKFPSNSTCKFDLYFSSKSTFTDIARSTPKTSAIRNTSDNDATSSLREAKSKFLNTNLQIISRKVQSVRIKDGKIYRYWGCKACSSSISKKDPVDRKYYCKGSRCNNIKKGKSRKGVACERKICFTIYNVQLWDDKNDVSMNSVVIFDSVCELLLKKCAHEFDTDGEAVTAWEEVTERNRFDITLKRNKKKKSSPYASPIFVDLVNNVLEEASRTPAIMESTPDDVLTPADIDESDESDFVDDGFATTAECEMDISLAKTKKKKRKYPDFLKFEMKLQGTAERYSEWAVAYQMNSMPRGLVLLINNFNFPHRTNEPQRLGSEIDIQYLQNGFLEMGYRIYGDECQVDVKTSKEFGELIRGYKDQLLEQEVDSIFVVISSHGLNLQIELCGGELICVVEELMILFSDDNFPQYQGKPKVFMPIVCQDLGRKQITRPLHFQTNQLFDMLVCCPALPGYTQNRSNVKGSLFVNRLMFNLMQYALSWDFVEILNKVQDDVKNEIITKKLKEWTVPHHIGSTFRPFYLVSKPTQGTNVESDFPFTDMEID